VENKELFVKEGCSRLVIMTVLYKVQNFKLLCYRRKIFVSGRMWQQAYYSLSQRVANRINCKGKTHSNLLTASLAFTM
jgi:hypothetical protein